MHEIKFHQIISRANIQRYNGTCQFSLQDLNTLSNLDPSTSESHVLNGGDAGTTVILLNDNSRFWPIPQ